MSYVERVLQPGETLLCRSRLHWLIYLPVLPFLAIFVLGAALYLGMQSNAGDAASAILPLGLIVIGALGAMPRQGPALSIGQFRLLQFGHTAVPAGI